MKRQARRPRLVIQLDHYGNLERQGGRRQLAQAQRAPAEAAAAPLDEDAAGALPPAAVAGRLPLVGVEPADGQPGAQGDGVGLFEQWLEGINADRETKVGRHQRLDRQDAVDPTLQVEQRAAAVARLDGDGDLDHRPALQLTPPRDDASDDAVRQSLRVADGYDGLPVLERGRVAQRQRRQPLGSDPEDGQVEAAVVGVDVGDGQLLAVGRLDLEWPVRRRGRGSWWR